MKNEKVTRSIFNETKYYDQIAWFNNNANIPNLSLEFVDGGNYDFMPTALSNRNINKLSLSWHISDHYPLWAEFKL